MNLNAKTYFSMADENKKLQEELRKERDENIVLRKQKFMLLSIITAASLSDTPKQVIKEMWESYKEIKDEYTLN